LSSPISPTGRKARKDELSIRSWRSGFSDDTIMKIMGKTKTQAMKPSRR